MGMIEAKGLRNMGYRDPGTGQILPLTYQHYFYVFSAIV
jgi:hypothetical protein